jgi:hypothetical protein
LCIIFISEKLPLKALKICAQRAKICGKTAVRIFNVADDDICAAIFLELRVPGVSRLMGVGQALVALIAVEGGPSELLRHDVAHHVVAPAHAWKNSVIISVA